jgi:hypothetical protein
MGRVEHWNFTVELLRWDRVIDKTIFKATERGKEEKSKRRAHPQFTIHRASSSPTTTRLQRYLVTWKIGDGWVGVDLRVCQSSSGFCSKSKTGIRSVGTRWPSHHPGQKEN